MPVVQAAEAGSGKAPGRRAETSEGGSRPAGEPGARTASERAWDMVREIIAGGEMAERMGGLCREYSLSPGPLKALQLLHKGGLVSMRDVARCLGCDPSYVTSLVDGLAEHGLVERRSHPVDRRIKTVVLTTRGVAVAQRVEEAFSVPPAAFAALSERDAEQLARLLTKIARNR